MPKAVSASLSVAMHTEYKFEKMKMKINKYSALGSLCLLWPLATVIVILSHVEKDASQGRRNEGVVFVWDDGHVGNH